MFFLDSDLALEVSNQTTRDTTLEEDLNAIMELTGQVGDDISPTVTQTEAMVLQKDNALLYNLMQTKQNPEDNIASNT